MSVHGFSVLPRFRAGALTALALAVLALAPACNHPRMKHLTTESFPALPRDAKVEVYVGELSGPNQEIALIESKAYSFVDDSVKQEQLEELRRKARRLGANAIDNVHILPKRVQRFTADESVPFQSWRQGQYELYFMRATAVRIPESAVAAAAPGAAQRPVEPQELFSMIETLPPPRPLTADAATTPAAPAAPAAEH